MPRFFYTVRNQSGKRIINYEDAANQEELIARLQAKGMTVINIMLESEQTFGVEGLEKMKGVRLKYRHTRVTESDTVLFFRQLATLLGAGVTILKCLDVISKQVSSRKLYSIIQDLTKSMEAGLSLHEAMARHPVVFDELVVNLVESGEASGNLAVVLSRLAGYMERAMGFKRKVISAILYPVILVVAGLSALLFLTIKIIPVFGELFSGFGIELPLLTKILVGVSLFIRSSWLLILLAIVAAVYFLKGYLATKEGRRRLEQMEFNLPLFGDFFRAIVVERFSSEMSTLVESGVPILYSLEITEHSVGNLTMADIVRSIKEDVRDGKNLSLPLEKSSFFEPMVVQMIIVGEEIGELPQMFKKINAFYQEYIETFLTRFTILFEPIMLVFMGFLIGTIVIGMFLPIFEIARIGG